jgi:hypothetical protein
VGLFIQANYGWKGTVMSARHYSGVKVRWAAFEEAACSTNNEITRTNNEFYYFQIVEQAFFSFPVPNTNMNNMTIIDK